MVELDPLAQQPRAIFAFQGERRPVGVASVVRRLPVLVIVQPGLVLIDHALPVRPAVHFHLQQPEIEPQLDFYRARRCPPRSARSPIWIKIPSGDGFCNILRHAGPHFSAAR